jgi:peptidoglycan hydrolase-like protein with peptidoglycan-binding domain
MLGRPRDAVEIRKITMPKEVVKWGKQYTLVHHPETENTGEYWEQAPYKGVEHALDARGEVEIRQRWLNDERGEHLVVDGKIGPLTAAAIERYQNVLGVEADGIWGPETEIAHDKYFYSKYQPTRHPNLEVVWTRKEEYNVSVPAGEDPEGWVQIGIDLDKVDLMDYMRYDDDSVTAKTFYTDKLTRHQINELIRVLKRARNAAYGSDE